MNVSAMIGIGGVVCLIWYIPMSDQGIFEQLEMNRAGPRFNIRQDVLL